MADAALSDAIKARARQLGFALCGITTADPPPHHRHYARWLAEGRAGEMLYLHRQEPKRGDLHQVLPGAKSVICVALNYAARSLPSVSRRGPPSLPGPVARYARFDDYHETLWQRLEDLLAFIQHLVPNCQRQSLLRHRPHHRTRPCHARRTRLDRQAHQPHLPPPRQLVLPRRNHPRHRHSPPTPPKPPTAAPAPAACPPARRARSPPRTPSTPAAASLTSPSNSRALFPSNSAPSSARASTAVTTASSLPLEQVRPSRRRPRRPSPRRPLAPDLLELLALDDDCIPRTIPPQPHPPRQTTRPPPQRLRRARQPRRPPRPSRPPQRRRPRPRTPRPRTRPMGHRMPDPRPLNDNAYTPPGTRPTGVRLVSDRQTLGPAPSKLLAIGLS